MRGHHVSQTRGQEPSHGGHVVHLRAARIGHQRLSGQRSGQLRQHLIVLLHRHSKQNEIGALHGDGNIIARLIDHLQFECAFDVRSPASHADDSLYFAGMPECSRNGSADQADSDDNQFVAAEFAGCSHRTYFNTVSSAARKRAFSDSVPIDMRRCSGMP